MTYFWFDTSFVTSRYSLDFWFDTILCIEHDMDKAVNLKLLLYSFELMSGLKINFLKSEIYIIGGNNLIAQSYSDLFGCNVGEIPFSYLGVPVVGSRLLSKHWDFLCAKVAKKLDAWRGGSLSSRGRAVLIKACLESVPTYHMSMYRLPKNVVEKLDKSRKTFFWQGNCNKKKYHLVKWSRVCRPKEKGGLGFRNIEAFNTALLCKWWWCLETKQGMWLHCIG